MFCSMRYIGAALKVWTIGASLIRRERERGIRAEAQNTLDHLGVLDLARYADLPVFHGLLGRKIAELDKCGSGYRAGCVYSIPAVDENRLAVIFDRVIDFLVHRRSSRTLPALVDIIELAL